MNTEEKRFHAAVAAMRTIALAYYTNKDAASAIREQSDSIGIGPDEGIIRFAIERADMLLAELDRTKWERKADADGWIPHRAGDPMPCPGNHKILVKTEDFYESEDWSYAFTFDWRDSSEPGQNIIAWKPAQE